MGGDIGETPLAFEVFRKVARNDVDFGMIGVMLEELMAGFRLAQAPKHTELGSFQITDQRS